MHIVWCLFLSVLVAGVNVAAQCSKYSNGCSINKGFPYKTEFTPACDRHDTCYGCGANFGITQLKCDNAFLSDMIKICRDRKLPTDCLPTTGLYYSGVRAAGLFFYRKTPDSYCSESWIRSCLP